MKKIKFKKENIALSLILILSGILNFANIGIEGYGNGYYAAGVKSMTMSLKNFFFVSFDPAGFVTIDKPPLGFWIQTISAKIFGFSGWSIIFPQAIAGVVSVYLTYYLVKRTFGNAAGLISALCLAITPVFVAASRNNTIDNLLVVTLLFACLALSIAAEKGKLKYLIISLVLVGAGFNIKMLEAYMIGPAFYITYLFSSAIVVKRRAKHLVIGTIILFAVSLCWAIIVDLVPAQNRPYVGSSTNNSVIELIVGHNGLERLSPNNKLNKSSYENNVNIESGENQSVIPGNQNSVFGTFGGKTSATITRLFSKNSLSDQIVWFLPIALLGFIAGAIKERLSFKLDNKRKISLTLWFLWLMPEFIYFSFTKGLTHPYYLTMMAPPAAALTGIGVTTMWEFYKCGGWKSWFLPVTFIVEELIHILMIYYYNNKISSVVGVVISIALILGFISSFILIVLSLIKRKDANNLNNNKSIKLKKVLVGISMIGILITPLVGASAVIKYKVNGTSPCAGLELLSKNGKGNLSLDFAAIENSENAKLIKFLTKHKTNEKYLLAASSSQSVDDIIIKTGEPAMAIGGFSGSDEILTLDQFKELVKSGEVRYVLTGGMKRKESSEIMDWVTQNGREVPESEYKDVSTSKDESSNSEKDTKNSKDQNSEKLYDLKDIADTLK